MNSDTDPKDDHGHGTHVAGIVGANGSLVGVAPDVTFLAYKVCNSAGSCPSEANIIAAVDAAIGNSSDVISMSIGGEKNPNNGLSALSAALSDAVAQGVVVVVAAGNNGPSTGCVSSPGDAVDIITIGNSNDQGTTDTSDDTIVSSSCSGPSAFGRVDPDLVAPGNSITSTWLDDATNTISGTSMATPHVSGAAALLLEYNATLTPAMVRGRLMHTASTINEHLFEQGSGIVNVTKAIEYNLTVNLSGSDRWETTAAKGELLSKNVTVKNTNDFAINITIFADNLTDLEGDFSMSNSSYTFPAIIVPANSETTVQLNYSVPANANASIYGSTLDLRSNRSHFLRVPVVISVQQSLSGTINGIVDKKRSSCSNSACGDKVMYYFSVGGNKQVNLTWTSTSNDLDLYVYNSSGTQIAVSGQGTTDIENVTLNSTYAQFWVMVHSYTLASDSSDFSYNLTLTTTQQAATVTLTTPQNSSYHKSSFNLNLSISDANIISEANYTITNSSGRVVQSVVNESVSATSLTWTDLVNVSNSTFTDGNYTLTVFVNDSENNSTEQSFLFIVDKTVPALSDILLAPTTVYNNNTVSFRGNVTDSYLNTSAIFLQSNFSGSMVNYSFVFESGDTYNYSVGGTANFSNQENVSYQVYVVDQAGNVNSSAIFSFLVQNRAPEAVSIALPSNGDILEIGNSTSFQSSAMDKDGDSLTYRWNFSDETSLVSSQNTSHQFNSTGSFIVILNISDSFVHNLTNMTITVNDTKAPSASALSYATQHHLSRDGNNYSVNATLFDYTGISSSTLEFNNTTQTSSCSSGKMSWNCSWTIRNVTVGSYSFSLNATDNFTTQHRHSVNYTFSVTSCSDSVENGDETDTDCGGSCSACGESSSSSSSSSSSGGAGGGSSSSSSAAAAEAATESFEDALSEEEAAAAESSVEPTEETPLSIASGFTQEVTFVKDEYAQVTIADEHISVKGIEIKTSVDKVTTLVVQSLSGKPDIASSLENVYQYLEMTVDLSADDIEKATVTFEVPKSWLEEKGYLTESIMLNTFENDNWKELPTTMVDETNTTITYKAELKHFSYFAITGKKASSNLTGAAITLLKNFSGALNGRVVVLFSFVMLILVLGMIYVKIRERDY